VTIVDPGVEAGGEGMGRDRARRMRVREQAGAERGGGGAWRRLWSIVESFCGIIGLGVALWEEEGQRLIELIEYSYKQDVSFSEAYLERTSKLNIPRSFLGYA
jgi:hypothetical protein